MQVAPDPVFGPDGPTPWKLVLIGFFLGCLVMHFLTPREPTRVIRLRVIDGGDPAVGGH